MRAKHRHELKTNELAEWISHLPEWTKQNLRMIIYVSVVVILVLGSYIYHQYQKNTVAVQRQLTFAKSLAEVGQGKKQIIEAQAKGVDISYMLIQTADNLKSTATNTKDGLKAAFALIKRGEALRSELHYRMADIKKEELLTQINLAKASYSGAIERCPNNPSLAALANFGLGICEEEVGNFGAAGKIYRQIAEKASFEGTITAVQAKRRLETLDNYKQEVVFKADVNPVPSEPAEEEVELKVPEGTTMVSPANEVAIPNIPNAG